MNEAFMSWIVGVVRHIFTSQWLEVSEKSAGNVYSMEFTFLPIDVVSHTDM